MRPASFPLKITHLPPAHALRSAGLVQADAWLAQHAELSARAERIRQEGPLRSADLKVPRRLAAGGIGKKKKEALENLLMRGDLMVGAQKFPTHLRLARTRAARLARRPRPNPQAVRRTFLLRAVACLGVARASWASDYFRIAKTGVAKELDHLAKAGELLTTQVDGWEIPVYVHPDNAALLAQAPASSLTPNYLPAFAF